MDEACILSCRKKGRFFLKTRFLTSSLEHLPSSFRRSRSPPGFEFLGFNIRQYPVGKSHARRGYKTFIKPSKDSQQVHYQKLKQTIDRYKAATQADLISALNPIIKGWSNYFSSVCSKKIFDRLDDLVYKKVSRWAKRRHPNKSWKWISSKYWKTIGNRHWCFSTDCSDNPLKLFNHAETKIVRHTKVKGIASPMDGNLIYWSSRMGKHPEFPRSKAFLLKRQKGKCNHCGLYFKEGDSLELDHIIPKSNGGTNRRDNLQLLHKHCHHDKTREDISTLVINYCAHDKSCVAEERSESKDSCSVLQTSRMGDRPA